MFPGSRWYSVIALLAATLADLAAGHDAHPDSFALHPLAHGYFVLWRFPRSKEGALLAANSTMAAAVPQPPPMAHLPHHGASSEAPARPPAHSPRQHSSRLSFILT